MCWPASSSSSDRCAPVIGKSTLNRLELRPRREAAQVAMIDYDAPSLEALFVDIFIDGHERAPRSARPRRHQDMIHGRQEAPGFHGYYDSYCYLLLYVVGGRFARCQAAPRQHRGAACGDEVARDRRRIRPLAEGACCARFIGTTSPPPAPLMAWCEAAVSLRLRPPSPNATILNVLAVRWPGRQPVVPARRRLGIRDVAYLQRPLEPTAAVAQGEHLPDGANHAFRATSLGTCKAIDARRPYEVPLLRPAAR